MKLHQIRAHCIHLGSRLAWAGSTKDAAAQRKRLREEGAEILSTELVDVPTKKPDLIRWLNVHCDNDNG